MRVLNIRGFCEGNNPDVGAFKPAQENKAYPLGTLFRTGADSSALLVFSPQESVQLLAGTEVVAATPDKNPDGRVVRLVAGLGTRAVDRTDDDYTRLIALNEPELRPETNFGAIARHAQRRMDALDLVENRVVTGPFADLVADNNDFPQELFTTREQPGLPPFLTFDGLLKETSFVNQMRAILECLHAAYPQGQRLR